MSKFYPSEFIPYARFFYGNYPSYKSGAISRHPHIFKGDVKREFDKAWLYHIHRNKHHWQHWLLQEDNGNVKNIKIPVKYLKEMVCDWRGAGEAITGTDNTKVWYLENKKCMSFKRIDRRWVEEKLGLTRYRESERSKDEQ